MDLPDAVNKQHLAELSLVRPVFSELGLPAALVEADDDHPLSELEVDLGTDDLDRQRTMHVRLVPAGDDQFAATTYVEFTVVMPYVVTSEKSGEVGEAIALVNDELAVGTFSQRGSEVRYRYVLTADSSSTVSDAVLADLVPLLVFEQEHFSDYLEGVLDDEVSLLVLPKLLAADPG